MDWKYITYADSRMKNHFVHPGLVERVVSDIMSRYGQTPVSIEDIDVFTLDPGGACFANPVWHETSIEGMCFHVRSEHVPFMQGGFQSRDMGNGVTKVYFGVCLVIPTHMLSRLVDWVGSIEETDECERLVGFIAGL